MNVDRPANPDIADAGEPSRIQRDRLLLVEGEFDLGFLRALLSRHRRAGVQIEPLGGVGSYAAKVQARVLAPGFEQVRWLGLARDADNDAQATFASICHAITQVSKRLPLNVPTRPWEVVSNDDGTRSVTLFIFPDGTNPGDLERFIWEALMAEPEATCVEQYVQCLGEVGCEISREWKTRVYAYLSAQARPDSLLTAATRAGELPTGSPVFHRLLDLIPADNYANPKADHIGVRVSVFGRGRIAG